MTQSWQIACPRCRWPNSGANARCAKCGQPLRQVPGMLVAGKKAGASMASDSAPAAPPAKVAQPGGFFPRLIALILDVLILAVITVPVRLLWEAQVGPTVVKPGTTPESLALSDLQQAVV